MKFYAGNRYLNTAVRVTLNAAKIEIFFKHFILKNVKFWQYPRLRLPPYIDNTLPVCYSK